MDGLIVAIVVAALTIGALLMIFIQLTDRKSACRERVSSPV